jgi:hypothetical protein
VQCLCVCAWHHDGRVEGCGEPQAQPRSRLGSAEHGERLLAEVLLAVQLRRHLQDRTRPAASQVPPCHCCTCAAQSLRCRQQLEVQTQLQQLLAMKIRRIASRALIAIRAWRGSQGPAAHQVPAVGNSRSASLRCP